MLTVGEGLSISLFVKQLGAAQLPFYYIITAVFNFFIVSLYFLIVDKISNLAIFKVVLVVAVMCYLFAWCLAYYYTGSTLVYGVLLISREVTHAIIIVHFGNFIMDYFTRSELDSLLPLIYSGGRFGGILGGLILGFFSVIVGVLNLVFFYVVLGVFCLILLFYFDRKCVLVNEIEDTNKYSDNLFSFFKYIISMPFLFWLTIFSFLFIVAKTFLNFEYNTYFDSYFSSEIAMAQFIGYYSMIALFISVLMQLFAINRAVSLIGLKGTLAFYNILFFASAFFNIFPMTILTATYARLIENEFRFGIRNPISTLITNKFPKKIRSRARAWTIGVVNPCALFIASYALLFINSVYSFIVVCFIGLFLTSLYMYSTSKVYGCFEEECKIKIFK